MISFRNGSLFAADLKRWILVGSAVSLVGLGRGGLVGQRRRKVGWERRGRGPVG